MRTCTRCGMEKEPSNFFVKDKKTGRLHTQCKQCYKDNRATFYAEHYAKYADLYRSRARARRALIRSELHDAMASYLRDKACTVCGENDIRVLDFDHINPSEKSIGVARAMTNGYKWKDIVAEINKCQILCANCHRKRTAENRGWYRIPE